MDDLRYVGATNIPRPAGASKRGPLLARATWAMGFVRGIGGPREEVFARYAAYQEVARAV